MDKLKAPGGFRYRQACKKANLTRYRPGSGQGHYESYFQRANHPKRPLAFWIRYTIFSPADDPKNAIGELWAVWFDGETGNHVAVKNEMPISECKFAANLFDVKMGDAHIDAGRLTGSAESNGEKISWDLTYAGDQPPLFDFPLPLYKTPLPKAKALVGLPGAFFSGSIKVGDKKIKIDDWLGSQNHNWGSKHTDHYAWGQVAGFDNDKSAFLEAATARLKIGPVWTPLMTVLTLRYKGVEYPLNSLLKSFGKGSFDYFDWEFGSENDDIEINGRIKANKKDFVGLTYYNPPGGEKACLNSKIASCELDLRLKKNGEEARLVTKNRAAFEILTDDLTGHGITLRV